MKRTIKMSDGLIAKKGMYVVVINGRSCGHEAGQTTRIVDSSPSNCETNSFVTTVFEAARRSTILYESKYDLRKATVAEVREYKKKYGKSI